MYVMSDILFEEKVKTLLCKVQSAANINTIIELHKIVYNSSSKNMYTRIRTHEF